MQNYPSPPFGGPPPFRVFHSTPAIVSFIVAVGEGAMQTRHSSIFPFHSPGLGGGGDLSPRCYSDIGPASSWSVPHRAALDFDDENDDDLEEEDAVVVAAVPHLVAG